jgi:hypothetical protein
MKNLSIIAITAFVFIVVLLMMNDNEAKFLAKRIKQYEKTTDSLRYVVSEIDATVQHKDGILLRYLVSLDNTLEELNKESAKNRSAISSNFVAQDSARVAFCREMTRLEQNPSECQ